MLVASAVGLASCEKETAAPSTAPLLEHRWLLYSIDGAALPAAAAATATPYVEFIDLGHCTVGLGPCNNFSTRFVLAGDGRQLRIGRPIATDKACPAQALESQYLTNLGRTTRYQISGSELRLYAGEGSTPLLTFRLAAQ